LSTRRLDSRTQRDHLYIFNAKEIFKKCEDVYRSREDGAEEAVAHHPQEGREDWGRP
jgi:hypothetical protein